MSPLHPSRKVRAMSHPSSPFTIGRRRLLSATAGVGLAAAAGSLLSGCSGGSDGPEGSGQIASTAKVPLPTHVPFEGVTPDLPADPEKNLLPGFYNYPAERVKTVNREVGSGGEMTSLVVTFSPPPPSMEKNAYWQAINSELNVTWKPTLVPSEYATKLAATLAGGDIPDLITMYVAEAQGLRRFESLAQAKFANLSEHLSGDAVKEYPNLARLAPETWAYTLVNGEIYATPTLRVPISGATFVRTDVITDMGLDPNVTTRDDFDALCAELSDPDNNRYALAGKWPTNLFYPMHGVPNGWGLGPDGALVKDFETEGWTEAVAYMADTWKKGYWHPDTATATQFDIEPLFANGTVLMRDDNFVRYTVRGIPDFEVGLLPPFGVDGVTPGVFETRVTDFVTFIKKGDPERVKETLRVLDWLSAPFGSEENYLRTFGVEGEDHTLQDGRPTLTEQGDAEVSSLSLRFQAGGPDVLFASNGYTEMVDQLYDYQVKATNRISDPVSALYAESATATTSATTRVTDTMTDVIVGRKKVADLAEAVTAWRKDGGDKLREEYQTALAEVTTTGGN